MSREEFNLIIGQAIKKRRGEHGWTLDDVIALTGDLFSRSSLSAYENGTLEINIYQFFLLEKLLGKLPRPELSITIN